MIEIYKHTSKTSGKSYVGQSKQGMEKRLKFHLYTTNNENIKNTHFHNAIKKYGVSDFQSEVLIICDTKSEADSQEIHFIKLFDTYNNGYNSTYGGSYSNGFKGHTHTKESRKKISDNSKTPSGVNHPMWGLFGKDNPNFGRKNTKEARERMSVSAKGRTASAEARKNMSISHRHNVWINDGIKNKHVKSIKSISYIFDGWKYGRLISEKEKDRLRNVIKGRKWVYNSETEKLIYPNQISEFMEKGWQMGRLK